MEEILRKLLFLKIFRKFFKNFEELKKNFRGRQVLSRNSE